MKTCNTPNGMQVEVFDVGAEQARGWCGWQTRKRVGRLEQGVYLESMRKGRYVVVYIYGTDSRPFVAWDGSLSECLQTVDDITAAHGKLYEAGALLIEVWHLVDDNELWAEWELGVALSRLSDFLRSDDCGEDNECDDCDFLTDSQECAKESDLKPDTFVVLLHEVAPDERKFGRQEVTSSFGAVAFESSATAEAFGRWCHLFWSLDVSLLMLDSATGVVVNAYELCW